MKKIFMFLVAFYFLLIPANAYADGESVEVKVNGKVKKGSEIEIIVDIKNVDKFYAASVDYTYNTEMLKVNSITAGEFISKYSDEIMELGGETDKNGNTATYSFTFLGDKPGIKGTGTIAIINATVLKNGRLSITENDMKIKLVQRSGDSVENYPYQFIGYNVNTSEDNTTTIPDRNDNNSETNNTSSNNESTSSNESNDTDNRNNDNNAILEDTNEGKVDNNDSSNNEENNRSDNTNNSDSTENNGITTNKIQQVNSKKAMGIISSLVFIIVTLVSVVAYILYRKYRK